MLVVAVCCAVGGGRAGRGGGGGGGGGRAGRGGVIPALASFLRSCAKDGEWRLLLAASWDTAQEDRIGGVPLDVSLGVAICSIP